MTSLEYLDNIIEEYKDGRINTSYLMLSYLGQLKEKIKDESVSN